MPAATIALEIPSPMPLAPPVTNATLSFSCSIVFQSRMKGRKERGALVAGRASFSIDASISVEVLRELHVPLARSTRLAFQRRLTEGGQVELVQVVLLVRQVRGTHRNAPVVLGAGPLQSRVEQLVILRAGLRLGG